MVMKLQHCWRGVVCYIKYLHLYDEGTNLTTMATTLHFIIGCECLKILRLYDQYMFWACDL
jgi:hypothetical protein